MKRRITIMAIVLTLGAILALWYIMGPLTPSESEQKASMIDSYEKKLGFRLPEPDRIETIWSSRGWFGDGESLTMLYFSSDHSQVLGQGFNLITEANLDYANSIIRTFVDDTLSIRNAAKDVSDVFEEHPVEVSLDDYYYYKREGQGGNYVIAAYKKTEQKLYFLEWYQ